MHLLDSVLFALYNTDAFKAKRLLHALARGTF